MSNFYRMKKLVFSLFVLLTTTLSIGQSRGIRIGYIDMEYILQNVPDYAQANNDLEQKAQKWKQEVETKKGEITKLKDALKTERVLLTKELIEEREEEIAFQEKELLDYQQKRFGPTGDLITQKSVLVKPIQDQVFTAAQDIAEKKKYDFIFDKSSDLTMLFAAKKFDISDQVIRALTRATRRQQMSKKELKEEEKKEMLEDMADENPEMSERQKQLEERKKAREKLIEDRKAAADARRQAALEKREQAKADREAKKNGTSAGGVTPPASDEKPSDKEDTKEKASDGSTAKPATTSEKSEEKDAAKEAAAEAKKQTAEDRAKKLEERKQALEEKRRKALEAREAAKQAKQAERENAQKAKDTTN